MNPSPQITLYYHKSPEDREKFIALMEESCNETRELGQEDAINVAIKYYTQAANHFICAITLDKELTL
jgi:hypothetical protein